MIVDTVFLEKGLNAILVEAIDETQKRGWLSRVMPLFLETKSTGDTEKYPFLGDYPEVREWLGDKIAGELKDYEFEIRNKDWYAAIEIDRNELSDDSTGKLKPRVESMVESLALWRFELVAALLEAGTTGLAFDGSAYFANRTAPNDNLLSGSGADTVAHIQTDLVAARSAMMAFTSDAGRVLGIEMDTVVIPAAMEWLMNLALSSEYTEAGGAKITTPFREWIKNVIVLPQLTDANDWYGFATSRAMRPFIFQNREDPKGVLDDTMVKRNRKLVYSAEMRGDAGYCLPSLGVKVVNT